MKSSVRTNNAATVRAKASSDSEGRRSKIPRIPSIEIAAVTVGAATGSRVTAVAFGMTALFACLMLIGVQQQLLSLAVYRFAVDGRPIGGFDADDLSRALQPRR